MSIDRYNNINRKGIEYDYGSIKTFLPNPKEDDYKSGYIVRYFIQSTNNKSTPIYEINKSSYLTYAANPFFVNVKLDWRLTGTPEDIKKSNRESVRIASKTISKISLYLPNLLQFHKK
jgi:hypothetical protein